jgi:hypothetical protein
MFASMWAAPLNTGVTSESLGSGVVIVVWPVTFEAATDLAGGR